MRPSKPVFLIIVLWPHHKSCVLQHLTCDAGIFGSSRGAHGYVKGDTVYGKRCFPFHVGPSRVPLRFWRFPMVLLALHQKIPMTTGTATFPKIPRSAWGIGVLPQSPRLKTSLYTVRFPHNRPDGLDCPKNSRRSRRPRWLNKRDEAWTKRNGIYTWLVNTSLPCGNAHSNKYVKSNLKELWLWL